MAANRRTGPKAGDATGRQKAAQEAEQREAAAQRQSELTMINAQQAIVDQHGVFDPASGKQLDPETGDVIEIEKPAVEPDAGPGATAVVPASGSSMAIDFGVETAEKDDHVVIRVNETLSNVTIGAGNYFNFDEGKQYRVPRNVAAHLDEKGYLWH